MAEDADVFLASRTEHWARLITSLPSVTGTAEEAAFSDEFANLLRASPAFAGTPECVWQIPVPGGPHPRSVVLALLRGTGRRTIILTGHFDTVGIEPYGELMPFARDPDRLAPALVAALRREDLDARGERALADLEGAQFIPGCGLLDMKSGLAAGIAVMEAAARAPDRTGNLLLIAVPDEEANSAGARLVASVLHDTAEELGLDIQAAINLDAIADDDDGSAGQVVALGSVGKLLPSALVVGQPVHASHSLSGVSAPALAGALATAVEWLPSLTPKTDGELGAAPSLLGMRDSKPKYDVTTPASVWLFWNVALHHSRDDVLGLIAAAARAAIDELTVELTNRRAAIGPGSDEVARAPVISFDALFAEAAGKRPAFTLDFQNVALGLADAGHDLPELCRLLTEYAWQASGRAGPAVVIGFASTPYLPVELGEDPAARRLRTAVDAATSAVSARFGTSIGTVRFFPGISDMSFLGQADAREIETVLRNTPARAAIGWPQANAVAGVPIVNAGPWGRDFHSRLERAHRRYTFEVLPALIEHICRGVLEHPDDTSVARVAG